MGVGETCNTLPGPDILWGPDGPLQDPMKEESDVRGQDAYKKFAAACASFGVDLNQPDITVFVPTDSVIDEFEEPGGKLRHRRMFRKDFIDDASPGVSSEGASKSAS